MLELGKEIKKVSREKLIGKTQCGLQREHIYYLLEDN